MSTPGADLVVAGASWLDAVRRGGFMPPDRLIARVAGDRAFGRVLVVGDARSTPAMAARRLLGERRPPLPDGPPHRHQLTPRRLRLRDPVDVGALARVHDRRARWIGRRAAQLGHFRPAVLSTDPFLCAFGDLGWAGPVTYYAWDDWAAHPHLARWADAYHAAYRTLREREVRVAAVSDVILERVDPVGPHRCIPNGVDEGELCEPGPPPTWFTALPGPRVVYVGALGQRLDVDAVRAVASSVPGGTVALIGPVDEADVLDPLRDVRDVHLHGPVGRAEVVGILHAADVCIVPHRRTALTEAMSPLKVYEYLAAGRPVVATDLPGIRGLGRHVELVEGAGDFPAAVERALHRGPMPEEEREAFIRAHAWGHRLDELLDFATAEP